MSDATDAAEGDRAEALADTPPQDKAPRESCERCGGFPRGDWAAHKPMCSIGRDLRKPTTPEDTERAEPEAA